MASEIDDRMTMDGQCKMLLHHITETNYLIYLELVLGRFNDAKVTLDRIMQGTLNSCERSPGRNNMQCNIGLDKRWPVPVTQCGIKPSVNY